MFTQPPKNNKETRFSSFVPLTVAALMLVAAATIITVFAHSGLISVSAPPEYAPPVISVSTVPDNTPAKSAKQIYSEVSPSVLLITCYDSSRRAISSGSGFFISSDGLIATNAHVVSGASRLTATLLDGTEKTATVIGSDYAGDLAVIKISGGGYPVPPLGDSGELTPGDVIYAIGNPTGSKLRNTFTNGLVSSINRDIRSPGFHMELVQVSCPVNPGNSGGPLINEYGQIVGIVCAKMPGTDDEPLEGLGFAIPSSYSADIFNQLISKGRVENRPMLGISLDGGYTPTIERDGTDRGAYIYEVDRASDAYAQGLRDGDIIISANGLNVLTAEDIQTAKEGVAIGDTFTVTVVRGGGETLEISFKVMDNWELD